MKAPVALSIVLAAFLMCGCQPSQPGHQGSSPTPAASGPPVGAAQGEPCPTFNLTAPDGAPVKFDPNNNPDKEVSLLVFWSFRWDPNVKELLSRASQLHERYSPRGLNIIAITYDEEPDGTRKYLSTNKVPFDVAIGAAGTYERFGVGGIPTSILVDGNGKIVERWTGYYTTEELASTISPYLPGRAGN